MWLFRELYLRGRSLNPRVLGKIKENGGHAWNFCRGVDSNSRPNKLSTASSHCSKY